MDSNRRDSYRVRLAEGETIPAELHLGNGRKISTQMNSLSLGGVGVVIPRSDSEHRFAKQERLDVRFRLPHNPSLLSFSTQVRRIEISDTTTSLGLQFYPHGTPEEVEEREKKIWPYILEMQNREIRSLRKPPKPRS